MPCPGGRMGNGELLSGPSHDPGWPGFHPEERCMCGHWATDHSYVDPWTCQTCNCPKFTITPPLPILAKEEERQTDEYLGLALYVLGCVQTIKVWSMAPDAKKRIYLDYLRRAQKYINRLVQIVEDDW